MNEEIKKRVFYFKGKTEDEIKQLSNEEMLKVIGTRGRRSLKRGLTPLQKKFMEKVDLALKAISAGKQQPKLKTHCRDIIIVPKMIGLRIEVYTGKVYESVTIKQELVGHYLGEFALTRKRVNHQGGKK